jgi:Low-density lipoprotein receptor domain class A
MDHTIAHGGTHICRQSEFQCKSDGACIMVSKKCDNRRDCSDGSDEFDCLENNIEGKVDNFINHNCFFHIFTLDWFT